MKSKLLSFVIAIAMISTSSAYATNSDNKQETLNELINQYNLVVESNDVITESTPVFNSIEDYEAALKKVISQTEEIQSNSIPVEIAVKEVENNNSLIATASSGVPGYYVTNMNNLGASCPVTVTLSYHKTSNAPSEKYTSLDNVVVVGKGLQVGSEYIQTTWSGQPIDSFNPNNGKPHYVPANPGSGLYAQWSGYIKYTVTVLGVPVTWNSGESWGYIARF